MNLSAAALTERIAAALDPMTVRTGDPRRESQRGCPDLEAGERESQPGHAAEDQQPDRIHLEAHRGERGRRGDADLDLRVEAPAESDGSGRHQPDHGRGQPTERRPHPAP